MIVFPTEQQLKYLKTPKSGGIDVCYVAKTPVDILAELKKTDDFCFKLTGYHEYRFIEADGSSNCDQWGNDITP